jgi:prophage regulatory protein
MSFPSNERLGPANRMLGARTVSQMTSLNRVTIYRMAKAGIFPGPYQIGPKRIAWRETDVLEWLNSRPPVTWAAA